MHGYFDGSETPKPKDNAYQSIMQRLSSFMECLPTEADRRLLLNMISECYCKYNEAIKSKEKDDPSLVMPLVMALLVDHQAMVDKVKNHRRNNENPL
jgi:hypothetical protein